MMQLSVWKGADIFWCVSLDYQTDDAVYPQNETIIGRFLTLFEATEFAAKVLSLETVEVDLSSTERR